MRVTEQIDALKALATEPVQYLMVPRVLAAILMLPLLVVFGDVVGMFGGYFVAVQLLGSNPITYYDASFQYVDMEDFTSGLIKAAVFGLIFSVVACTRGYYTRRWRGGRRPFDDAGRRRGQPGDPPDRLLPDEAAVLSGAGKAGSGGTQPKLRVEGLHKSFGNKPRPRRYRPLRRARRVAGDRRSVGHGQERPPQAPDRPHPARLRKGLRRREGPVGSEFRGAERASAGNSAWPSRRARSSTR